MEDAIVVPSEAVPPGAPRVRVPWGEYRLARAPCQLVTRDIGSCVGVALYSPHRRAGGLIHVVMPDTGHGAPHPTAHADVAIGAVVRQLESFGAVRTFLEVKIAGGSNMFGFEVSREMDIGARNVASVRRALAAEGLRMTAEDVELHHPRSMLLDLASGAVVLRTAGAVYRVM